MNRAPGPRGVPAGRPRCWPVPGREPPACTVTGIPDAEKRVYEFPHQFSGGMRQRVLIAMALINRPKILIADEPTTALDVTIQAQILELLRDLQKEFGTSIILITHEESVASRAQRIIRLSDGKVLEDRVLAKSGNNL